MKKYKDYMDGVTVSDTLHEKLKKLNDTPKKSQPWQKYGAAAAALVLVLGLGAWGASRRENAEVGQELAEGPVASYPAIEIYEEPALAPAPVPMPNSPGMETMGGYEVRYGEGENSTVAYYMLPYIEYGEMNEEMTTDSALPVGVDRRDLTPEEIEALFGGETNLITHLNWSGYELYAHAMVWPDSSMWLLYVSGIKGDTGLEHFSLEVAPGQMPPSCYVYSQSKLNNIWEREVWAESYEGELASSRRVSFMDRDYGYRFGITGTDTGAVDELVSRLVRWVIAGGGLTFEKEEPAVNSEEMSTMPYVPSAEPTPTVEPVPEP